MCLSTRRELIIQKWKIFNLHHYALFLRLKIISTRKARLIGGGHKTTADTGDQYASMVKTGKFPPYDVIDSFLNSNKLALSGDISTAYINARCREKYTLSVAENFAHLQGKFVRIHKALYGLITSGHAWYAELNDFMRTFGWAQSRSDPSIWIKQESDGGYEYTAYHVDDFVCVSIASQKL